MKGCQHLVLPKSSLFLLLADFLINLAEKVSCLMHVLSLDSLLPVLGTGSFVVINRHLCG